MSGDNDAPDTVAEESTGTEEVKESCCAEEAKTDEACSSGEAVEAEEVAAPAAEEEAAPVAEEEAAPAAEEEAAPAAEEEAAPAAEAAPEEEKHIEAA